MIVKTDRDGRFFVAGNGNWRLAGPFETNDAAWAWIDGQGFSDNHESAAAPSPDRLHVRQARSVSDIVKSEVLHAAPKLLALPLTDTERTFVMSMQKRATRNAHALRITDKQANWWRRIVKKIMREESAA